jgi:hypothetical protein
MPDEVWVDGCWLIATIGPEQVIYNHEGREVFRLHDAEEKKPCNFRSFVASVITRLVGGKRISTEPTSGPKPKQRYPVGSIFRKSTPSMARSDL